MSTIYPGPLSIDARVINESINIMEPRFGASPSASAATNKAAILAAVSFAQGASRSRILIPEFTFNINGLMSIDHDDISIEGVDPFLSKIVLSSGSNSGVIRFNTASTDGTTYKNRNAIRNLVIDQQGLLQANQGSGIEAAVVFHQTIDSVVENLTVRNARNNAISARIGSRFSMYGKNVIDTVINGGLGGNGLNIGGASQASGPAANNFRVENLDVIGSNTRITDGVITSGVLTSASYSFSASDIGKQLIVHSSPAASTPAGSSIAANISISSGSLNGSGGVTVVGSGISNVGPVTASFGYIDVAVWLGSNVERLLIERANVIGGCNSGIVSEGGGTAGNATDMDIVQGYVENARNIALGYGDASGGGTVLKHERGNVAECTAINPQKGLALFGNGYKVTDLRIEGYYESGITVGGGAYNESDHQIQGFTIVADPTATGSAIFSQKASSGLVTKDLEIGPGRCIGNGANSYGVQLAGNIIDATFNRVRVSQYGKSGYIHTSSGGVGPSEIHYVKCKARNNYRSLSGTTTEQAGWSINAGDSVTFDGCRGYDDQTITVDTISGSSSITVKSLPLQGYYPKNGTTITGTGIPASTTVLSGGGTTNLVLSNTATANGTNVVLTAKTQKFGLHWVTATRGIFGNNDFSGNEQAAKNTAFDANTIYEGGGNIEKVDKYSGTATISNGFNSTVTTTAVRTGAIILVVGRSGVAHTSIQITNGVNFTINGPNGTYDWRIL